MSRITIEKRVTAAVTATTLRQDFAGDGKDFRDNPATDFILDIVFRLKQPRVDLAKIKADIAALLQITAPGYAWHNAFVRLRCGEIETALGLPHGEETLAAKTAWEAAWGGDSDRGAWNAYCDSFAPPKPAVAA